jgi:hypothetical protein
MGEQDSMTEKPPKPEDRPSSPRYKKPRKAAFSTKPPFITLEPGQHVEAHVSLLHQRLIGSVIVAWSKLESAIQDTIWHFLDLGIEHGRIVTCRNDVENNLIMLRLLGKRHLQSANQEDFSKILNVIKSLQEDRNFIAHGTWGTLTPLGIPVAMSLRKSADDPEKVLTESFPTTRMQTIIDRINGANKSLTDLMDVIVASRGRQPGQPPPS